jgi:hypothetical protein
MQADNVRPGVTAPSPLFSLRLPAQLWLPLRPAPAPREPPGRDLSVCLVPACKHTLLRPGRYGMTEDTGMDRSWS